MLDLIVNPEDRFSHDAAQIQGTAGEIQYRYKMKLASYLVFQYCLQFFALLNEITFNST